MICQSPAILGSAAWIVLCSVSHPTKTGIRILARAQDFFCFIPISPQDGEIVVPLLNTDSPRPLTAKAERAIKTRLDRRMERGRLAGVGIPSPSFASIHFVML
jgi:hypothetical protein